ncbi:hypothetical protein HBI56_126450 [Parastagonospora nodorum]|nr:hypothetical protein HBH50_012190 [Parastagonospora nodorum]KAH4095609.1 hypothetical protein HBH48_045610 [Parastagonospora nodorum]KAH4110558.1 hypothetical protein HBH46_022420 [Parastagonospora nodorum]KAH4118553.1 hypothetical protein HBH47_135900 [Parastagonospora nodorum]KAH4221372.1 hypothetical protein HBI06_156410 [Parastagonospora nodorum]
MKYTTAILALVAGAFAVPQASITSAPGAPIPSGLSPAVSCALNCEAGDVMCQAACLGNARPNASQVIDTNNCAAKCDQGDGSAAAATAYAKCVDGCINSLFPSSQTQFAPGAAAPAASQASSVKAGASAATGSANPTGPAATGSISGSGAAPASTGAADVNSARFAGLGFAGLLAVFAL